MSTVQEIESAIARLESRDVNVVADWLQAYHADKAARTGSAQTVRQTMHEVPRLTSPDVNALEDAIGS